VADATVAGAEFFGALDNHRQPGCDLMLSVKKKYGVSMSKLLDTAHARKLDAHLDRVNANAQHLQRVLSTFKGIGPQGTFLGSRKLGPDSPEYGWLSEVSRLLALAGIASKTGGGPGLMEAPHKGCADAGRIDRAIAVCADFFNGEEDLNPFVAGGGHVFHMPDFNSRHDGLFFGSMFHCVLWGRLGTIHELYDLMNRLKHSLLAATPVYFIERDGYWSQKKDFHTQSLGEELGPRISPEDYAMTKIVNILETTPEKFVRQLLVDVGF
jgi:predicted Rossmann-fold nucleotide-binding protein